MFKFCLIFAVLALISCETEESQDIQKAVVEKAADSYEALIKKAKETEAALQKRADSIVRQWDSLGVPK
jgi:hypothetical protein